MATTKAFYPYRTNVYGVCESIGLECFRTVRGEDREMLKTNERLHVCEERLRTRSGP